MSARREQRFVTKSIEDLSTSSLLFSLIEERGLTVTPRRSRCALIAGETPAVPAIGLSGLSAFCFPLFNVILFRKTIIGVRNANRISE
jgi:hypothetical protein